MFKVMTCGRCSRRYTTGVRPDCDRSECPLKAWHAEQAEAENSDAGRRQRFGWRDALFWIPIFTVYVITLHFAMRFFIEGF